ncbi:MAG: hypothetical protein LUQ25_01585 [Methanoregulaceae archaeon]|nr:hypothetical protein [Methanoregulaceae archaeon]
MCMKIPGIIAIMLFVIFTMPAGAGVTMSTGNATVSVTGETAVIPIRVDGFQDGLSGFNISIALSNPGVADIEALDFPAWAVLQESSETEPGSAWLKAVDLEETIGPGSTGVTLAFLTVRANSAGTTSLNTSVRQMSDDNGDSVDVYRVNGTFTCGIPGPEPATLTIPLQTGWNLVSTPRTLADGHRNASEVFGQVDTGSRSLFTYDASLRNWRQIKASDPIRPLDAIWIYSMSETAILLTFNGAATLSLQKDLPPGWNLVGCPDISQAPAHSALRSVSGNWTTAIGFNPLTQRYETSIVNGGSGSHTDEAPVYPGKGYWLFMRNPGILETIAG